MDGGTQRRSASGKRTGRLGVETDTVFHFIVLEHYCVLNFFIYGLMEIKLLEGWDRDIMSFSFCLESPNLQAIHLISC